jgi:hypothetical protein
VKTVLNANESRNFNRRTTQTRRVADRRLSPYAFGSEAWLANIEANYAYCPKIERRQMDRRNLDRRLADRRHGALPTERAAAKKMPQLSLTVEERKLIEDLYFYDWCSRHKE